VKIFGLNVGKKTFQKVRQATVVVVEELLLYKAVLHVGPSWPTDVARLSTISERQSRLDV